MVRKSPVFTRRFRNLHASPSAGRMRRMDKPERYRLTLESQRKGGYGRALSLTPARRRQIARAAAAARWKTPKKTRSN